MKIRILALLPILLFSQISFGLISGEISVGPKLQKLKTLKKIPKVLSNAITLSLHLDPIPVLPVSLGFSYMINELKSADFSGESIAKASVNEVGLEIKAWFPLMPIVTPYAKIRYVADSKYEISYEDDSSNFSKKLDGWHTFVGIEYQALPFIYFLAEMDIAIIQAKADKEGSSFNSQGLYFGAKVKI